VKSCKKYYQTLFFIFTFCIIHSTLLFATVRYVSKTGNSTPPYTTWETAADSIQECINVCELGDTIFVANGVYQEQVVMIPGLALIGAGMDSCTIDARTFASTNSRAIQVLDSCLIKGFNVLISNTDIGAGIFALGQSGLITQNKVIQGTGGITLWDSDTEVYDNICIDNRVGIYVINSNSIVRCNLSTSNYIGGADIHIQAIGIGYYPIIDSNYIEVSKTSRIGIRKSLDSSPTILNNLIILKRSGTEGIKCGAGGTSKIFNNLILAESAYSGIYRIGSSIQAINNYLIGNFTNCGISFGTGDVVKNNFVTNAIKGYCAIESQNLIFEYNNAWNNETNYVGFIPDTTNISVDPMIVNDDTTQGELDFHLQAYSPLIDAGDPTILDKDSTRSDIGLYGGPFGESYTYQDLAPRSPVNLTVNVDTLIKLKWNKNTETDFNHYKLYRDTTSNFQIDSTKLVSSVTDTFYYHQIPVGVESLYFKITAVDNQKNESNPSEEVGVLITSVEDEWKPLNNYILYQNYPNPFNPSTKISYKLKERGYVKLYVYDVKGELISVLVNEIQEAGYYEVDFIAGVRRQESVARSQLASGVYIYQIFVKGENNIPVFSDIKKMILMK
jgi:hypothetical protein